MRYARGERDKRGERRERRERKKEREREKSTSYICLIKCADEGKLRLVKHRTGVEHIAHEGRGANASGRIHHVKYDLHVERGEGGGEREGERGREKEREGERDRERERVKILHRREEGNEPNCILHTVCIPWGTQRLRAAVHKNIRGEEVRT